MHFELSARARPFTSALVAAAVLSACGGGGGSDTTTPPVTTQSLSGVVIDGPIMGATVCLDLNKNGSCDAGEPTSGATNAQGQYTISGLTTEQVNAGAPLIAVVPATAVDADNPGTPVGTAFTLKAPAGKHAVISPVTHLVQAGIAQGLTLAAAESAVAAQLQVSATNLYNNYVGASTGENATLASLAPTMVAALKAGQPIVVTPPSATAANYWVRQFNYTSASDYYLRFFYSTNVPDSSGLFTFYDIRDQRAGGTPVAMSSLYDTAVTATAQGWLPFNSVMPNISSPGSPYVSTWGNGYTYFGTRNDTDVSGMSVAAVVQQIQDLTQNTQSTIVGVNASALTGTMPAGAKIRKVTQTNTTAPVSYRVSDGTVPSATTLASMVAAYPVPASPTSTNTVSMGNLHATAGCGTTAICLQERMRAAFGSSNAVTYYLCDIQIGSQNNCQSVGTGTYSTGVAADNATPILKFAGLPAAANAQAFTRVFVERSAKVYYGFQEKLSSYTQTRLNKVAFEALAAALGIGAPAIGDTVSAYAGTWSASYAGSDTGTCASVSIDTLGHINGACVSSGVGGSFVVTGTVSSTGVASFTASGGTSSGALFSGTFAATTGSGTWTWPSHSSSGTWSATKQ